MKNSVKLTALALAFTLAACSNDSSDDKKSEDAAAPAAETPAAETTDATNPTTAPAAAAVNAARAANLAYLDENKNKEGVQVTESGLQYKVITAGTGATPTADDFVEVHYAGSLIDGTVFDSSYDRGETEVFPAGRLIKGWTEALTSMKVGDKWQLVIPAEIGYGSQGAGGVIPPNATLLFDVELLGIKTEEEAKAHQEAKMARFIEKMKGEQSAFLEENADKDGITTTESGLQYRVITEGEGKSPTETSKVTVHYAGTLINGEEFDSSYGRGAPASFPLNGVISGWTEGLQLMKEGGKYEFFIPYTLGYGERGSRSIPPFATLIFTVELISVDS